jgi:hypothetical protein
MQRIIVIIAASLAACSPDKTTPPNIEFAKYAGAYVTKPDFAQVEYDFPLVPAELARLTPETLKRYDQEQIDQIYARLTAGPIPDGAYDGDLFFPRGTSGQARVGEIAGGVLGKALAFKVDRLEDLGRMLWRGKVFYRDQRLLRNRIEDTKLLAPLIDGDLSKIPRIEVEKGKDDWLMFPARIYCGQSLLDSRRESVIIDYYFTDRLPGYRERPDYLAGRRGVAVRDEIRMVRPGFYLGRAYVGRVFLLNFTLYNEQVAERDGEAFVKTGRVNEDCWPGTQKRAVAASVK